MPTRDLSRIHEAIQPSSLPKSSISISPTPLPSNTHLSLQTPSSSQTNSSRHSLKILFLNSRSLFPKLDNLTLLCKAHSPDIVCISESWLSPEILDSELQISNYTLFRRDRNRHGGGFASYILSSLSPSLVPLSSCPAEFLLCFLSFHGRPFT